jgi:hypothetical protein
VTEDLYVSSEPIHIAEAELHRCPRGHEQRGSWAWSWYGPGPAIIAETKPVCVACLAAWLGETFPTAPVPKEEPR